MEHFHDKIQGWFTFPWLYSEMVRRFPSGSHFVEVGCWRGCSAAYMGVEIVNSKKDIKFDCIDWFKGAPSAHSEGNYLLGTPEGRKLLDENEPYHTCVKNLSPFADFVTITQGLSKELAPLYKDASLDFVFLDASHDYKDLREDLDLWGPKVKPDGVFAGHDLGMSGVNLALCEYFDEDPPPNSHKDFKKINYGFTRQEHYGYKKKLGGCWIWDKKIHGEAPADPPCYKNLHIDHGGWVKG